MQYQYYDNDLDYIFIRAENKQGKWDNFSIRELNKKQWENYLIRKFGNGKKFWKDANSIVEKEERTDEDKLGIINWLGNQGIQFVMIKREARK